MATYAAYRHIELDNVGCGKKRVLKPPGGGSSDIFGANEPDGNSRRIKNHLASNLVLSDEPTPVTPSRSPGNSHSRLFGPASPPKSTPRPNRSVSRILPLDGNVTNGNGNLGKTSPEPRQVTNGDVHDGVETPATPNGNSAPMTNGNRITNGGGQSPAAAPRQRVPPGGFSSGLW